jgi:CheY-like chemotaxis protein
MTFKKDTVKIPRYNVLVVDDEEEIRKLLVRILSKAGHQCLEAVDGVDALDKAILNKFDAIVADIGMPQMDGITLTKGLVKLYPDLPIMIITGHNEEYSAESAIAAGAWEFIKKPFSVPEFIIRFDKMMRNHESQCEIKEKYNKMLFNAQRDSSEEIERLKREIKTLGGKWSYFHDPND